MKRETYRAACDQAKSELRDILAEFDRLRSRKEQVEKIIAVLEPLAGPEDGFAAQIDRALDRRVDYTPVAEVREFGRLNIEDKYQERQQEEAQALVEALASEHKSLEHKAVDFEREVAATAAPVALEEPVAAMEEAEGEPVFQADEVSSDPIKRRIANALRHRVVLRDNREFNNAFSGGITRW